MSATFRRSMVGVLVCAAVLRLAIFQLIQRNRDFGFNDADYYSEQAIALVNGHWFIDPATGAPGAEHGPLTTVLAATMSWFDQPQNYQRLTTIATGMLCVAVLGLVGHELGRRQGNGTAVGLTAAGLAAVYPNLWLNDGLVMSESLCTLLVSMWILVGLRADSVLDPERTGADRGARLRYVILFGLVGGLAVLARSELALLPVFAIIMIWRIRPHNRAQLLGLLTATTLVVLSPWVGPNLFRFENPVTLTTNDGTTFRGANCDRTYSGREIGSWSVFCLVINPETVQLETSVRSARWRTDGLSYAADHVDRIPIVLVARVGRTLDLFGLDYQIDEDVRDGRPRLGSILGIAAFWLLAPLAVFGLWTRRGSERLLLWAPVVVVAVSTLAFYGGHRIRSPLEPVVVIGASLAIVRIAEALRRRSSSPTQLAD